MVYKEKKEEVVEEVVEPEEDDPIKRYGDKNVPN